MGGQEYFDFHWRHLQESGLMTNEIVRIRTLRASHNNAGINLPAAGQFIHNIYLIIRYVEVEILHATHISNQVFNKRNTDQQL